MPINTHRPNNPSPLMHINLCMFRSMITLDSWFPIGKAHGWGTFQICGAKSLILGPPPYA